MMMAWEHEHGPGHGRPIRRTILLIDDEHLHDDVEDNVSIIKGIKIAN